MELYCRKLGNSATYILEDRLRCEICEESKVYARKEATGTSIVQFLNYRSITGQSVERWEKRSIGSATLSLLETKVAGKSCVHFIERWRSYQSKHGCFTLQQKIIAAIIDEDESGWADFLLQRNETIEFPLQECTYMCADCQNLGRLLFPSDESDRS
jgi:hypothetical protein